MKSFEQKSSLVPLGVLLGASAAMAYFLDPIEGRVRRNRLAAGFERAAQRVGFLKSNAHEHSPGLVQELEQMIRKGNEPDDELERRVRAKIARVTRRFRAIQVSAWSGTVELKGRVLQKEHERIVRAVEMVRGVRDIDDDLEVYDSADELPELSPQRFALFEQHWPLAARLALGSLGVACAALSLNRRDRVATGIGLFGLALLARSAADLPLTRLFGIRRGVDLRTKSSASDQSATDLARDPMWGTEADLPVVREELSADGIRAEVPLSVR